MLSQCNSQLGVHKAAMLVAAFFGFADFFGPATLSCTNLQSASQLTMDTFDFGEVQIARNGKQSKQITP